MRTYERANRCAAGRHLVEEREVEVAVECQGQGARDRCGRHDEHVGVGLLRGEFGALAHAEFVLLVDDNESGIPDCLRRKQQGVSSDDDARARGGRFLFACRGAQDNGNAQGFEKFAESFVVLVRENLRRRHERSRVSRGNRSKHGRGGNDGFPAAHIAMEKPVHRTTARKVVEDLTEHALLRRGQGEGHAFDEFGEQLPFAFDDRSRTGVLTRALAREHALHFEKFFAGEGGARFFEFRRGGGEMNLADGRCAGCGNASVVQARENLEEETTQCARTPRADRRVDGRDAVEVDQCAIRRVGFEHLEIGMIEDEPAFFHGACPAVDDEILPGLEDFREVAQVEPSAAHCCARCRLGEREKELAASSETDHFRLGDDSTQADRVFRRRARERGELAAVLVTPRVMPEQIADGLQAFSLQRLELGGRNLGNLDQRTLPNQESNSRHTLRSPHNSAANPHNTATSTFGKK